MHLVDEVHFVTTPGRRVLQVFQQLAHVFPLGALRGINCTQINNAPFVDFTAGTTHTAGRGRHPPFAIQRTRQNPRNSGLAHAARTRKQVSMVQAIIVQCIDQGAQYMRLPNHFTKSTRAPFAGQNLIAHRDTK